MRLRLGTRGSQLARTQSEMIANALSYAGHEVDLVTIKTDGDSQRGSLRDGGTGLFVAQLRQALLASTIDVAVHSLKDMPTDPIQGLVVAAVSQRAEASDALCAQPGLTLASLPPGARVGTGSPRRAAQLLALRPDVEIVDIRGNVDQRLSRVHGSASTSADLHAVILAVAGLTRLGRADAISEVLNFLPAPGQGALAMECRANDPSVRQALALLEDPRTRASTTAERAVLAAMDAGCNAPVGAQGVWQGDDLVLTAAAWSPDGQRVVRSEHTLDASESPEQLGDRVAQELLRGGAAVLIEPDTDDDLLPASHSAAEPAVDEVPDQASAEEELVWGPPSEPASAKPIRTIRVALDNLDSEDDPDEDDGSSPVVIFDAEPDDEPEPRPRSRANSPVVIFDADPEPETDDLEPVDAGPVDVGPVDLVESAPVEPAIVDSARDAAASEPSPDQPTDDIRHERVAATVSPVEPVGVSPVEPEPVGPDGLAVDQVPPLYVEPDPAPFVDPGFAEPAVVDPGYDPAYSGPSFIESTLTMQDYPESELVVPEPENIDPAVLEWATSDPMVPSPAPAPAQPIPVAEPVAVAEPVSVAESVAVPEPEPVTELTATEVPVTEFPVSEPVLAPETVSVAESAPVSESVENVVVFDPDPEPEAEPAPTVLGPFDPEPAASAPAEPTPVAFDPTPEPAPVAEKPKTTRRSRTEPTSKVRPRPSRKPEAATSEPAPATSSRSRLPEPPKPPPVAAGVAADEVVPGATAEFTSGTVTPAPSRQPLKDRTIIIPRLDGRLTQSLRLAGATVTAIPLTRRRLLEVPDPVRPADWLVLTSANGVAALRHAGHHLNEYGDRIAVVGPATAQAVRAADAEVDLEPIKGSSAAALAGVFPPGPGSVVLASSALAERTLAERLSELGWTVYRVPTYTTEAISPKELPADLLAQWPTSDAVVLTSGSVARAVRELLGVPSSHTKVVALGEATKSMARQAGLPVHAVAATPDAAGVIEALTEALNS